MIETRTSCLTDPLVRLTAKKKRRKKRKYKGPLIPRSFHPSVDTFHSDLSIPIASIPVMSIPPWFCTEALSLFLLFIVIYSHKLTERTIDTLTVLGQARFGSPSVDFDWLVSTFSYWCLPRTRILCTEYDCRYLRIEVHDVHIVLHLYKFVLMLDKCCEYSSWRWGRDTKRRGKYGVIPQKAGIRVQHKHVFWTAASCKKDIS